MSSLYDKDLEAALDSFDNLFCRRCLVSIANKRYRFEYMDTYVNTHTPVFSNVLNI